MFREIFLSRLLFTSVLKLNAFSSNQYLSLLCQVVLKILAISRIDDQS